MALWAAVGPLALLLSALWRLAPRATDAFIAVTTVRDGLLLGTCAVGMVWFEGHRGFHRRVVPDVAARVASLACSAVSWRVALAPLVACELIGAAPPRLVRRWLLVAGVVGAILLTRSLAEPARGIVSAAVFCGLAWGTGSLLLALRSATQQRVVNRGSHVGVDRRHAEIPPKHSLVIANCQRSPLARQSPRR